MPYFKRNILFTILLTITQILWGTNLNDSLYFQTITMKHGLPGSIVTDFEQDSLGFIWIATNDGLCRYDGTRVVTYKNDPKDDNSLWNNFIQKLFIDNNENLWIATTDGLNRFDLVHKKMVRVNSASDGTGILDNSPIDIVANRNGMLFIGSYYSGISYCDKNREQFQYLTDTASDKSVLSSNYVNCLTIVRDSLLFIGYRNAGVDIYNLNTHTSVSLQNLAQQQLCSIHVKALCYNYNNGVWIGTDQGLSFFDIAGNTITNYPFTSNVKSFITDREILAIHVDYQDNLWIGTRRNGLVIIKQTELFEKGKKARYIQYEPDDNPGSLSYRTILSLFSDKDNRMWIGTDGGGVNYVESKHRRFGHLIHVNDNPTSLSYNKVWGITEDSKNNIWIGTDGDGVNVWNEKLGVFANYKHEATNKNSVSDNAIISALTDSQGSIWLGTYEGGINKYLPEIDGFKHYLAPDKLPANDVRCIYEDAKQRIWIGLNRAGIALYNEKTDEFESIKTTDFYDIRAIHATGDILWLGSYSYGLLSYNIKTGELSEIYPIHSIDSSNLQASTIYDIYADNTGQLWLATDNSGLCRYQIKTNEFKLYQEEDGLSNNKVHAILPDTYGNLWLSTNNGISKFNMQSEAFVNYNWHKGVQSKEFHNGSKLSTSNGLLFFGGIDGLNYFDPLHFQEIHKKPNLQFTGFAVLNNAILPDSNEIINKSIEYQPKIELNHEHSFFSIEYQTLDYPFSRDAIYEYILEGYDKTWISAGNQRMVDYKKVPPGTYVFKVKSFQANDKTKTSQIALEINIAPPFWKTIWAYLFYLGSIAALIFTVFKYRIKQFEYENRIAYEQKLRIKQEKLHEERLEFFTNISHELRTPLTIIGVALEEMLTIKNLQPKLKKNYETALKNSDRLKDLINKLLEFRRVEKGVANLAVSKIKLNDFLPNLMHDFKQLAKHHQINLKHSLPIDDIVLWIDQDKFSMIMNNLLSNAVKNTNAGGQIVVSADEDEDFILIKVKDNGKGIDKKNLKKIFNRYYKVENKSTDTGIGLALTKKLVELHQGHIEVESILDRGTRFILKFMKGKAHYETNEFLLANEEPEKEKNQASWVNDENIMLSGQHQIILLIDDNKEILDLLQDKFVEQFKILRAPSGEEGIQLARKYGPDLIISDIMMPGISGIEVCQQLKNDATTSHIPIILLTAKGSERDEIEGLNTGADDYISKPFKFTILKARVQSILENRRKIVDYFAGNTKATEIAEEQIPDKELLFLNKLNDYVLNKCLSENVSVFDMASDLGFSRTSLYRKVKSLTGMSINAFVRSIKIKKSAEFITNGMNVSEAAYSVGFEDLKYFRECFKKQIGKNPSDFK